ncbi:ankyrin repeat domain-containing protein 17 [Colletotrichum truncatum]|uniref:Ankyrin repeat domain-containing protein 17 n=1 Tax=Colletotrichum truncatum TaxID=5467 RepID=A0ACC3YKV0_COLTU
MQQYKYAFTTQSWDVHQFLCSWIGVTPHNGQFLIRHCWLGNVDMVQRLLDAGADPDGSVWDREVPLAVAARACHEDVVDILLRHGANPSSSEYMLGYPLMAAAAGGSLAIVRKLLDHGAIADLKEPSTIYYAVLNEHTEMVNLLFESFAPMEPETINWPLEVALERGLESMVDVLKGLGATVV